MLTSLVVAVAIVLHPGDVIAKKRVIRQSAPAYGQGLNKLLDKVAPVNPPTYSATQYLQNAITDADAWWTAQGSKPPPLDLHVEATPQGGAYANYHSGRLVMDPRSLHGLDVALQSKSLKKRRLALTQIWGYAAHERGHNIGYEHTPDNGLMADGIKSIPGRGYAWAAEQMPRPRKYRVVKKRG